jgi:hypothetical protein
MEKDPFFLVFEVKETFLVVALWGWVLASYYFDLYLQIDDFFVPFDGVLVDIFAYF